MPFPHCSHIALKRRTFYFRRRLPRSPREVVVSLATRDLRMASWLAARLDHAFELVVRKMQDRPDLHRIAAEYLRERLAWHRQQFAAAPFGSRVYDGSSPLSSGPSAFAHEDDEDAVGFWLDEAVGDLEIGNRSTVRGDVEVLAARHAVPEAFLGDLADALLRVRVEELRNVLGWLRNRGRGVLAGEESAGPAAQSSGPATPAVDRSSDIASVPKSGGTVATLSAVVDGYFEARTAEGGKRGQSIAQDRATLRMFVASVGDRGVDSYTRRDVHAFREVLLRLPADYSKAPRWRQDWESMRLRELGAAAQPLFATKQAQPLTAKTIKRHMSALGALFDYLIQREAHPGPNPAHGLSKVRDPQRRGTKRVPWTSDQLRMLFASPAWVGCLHEWKRSTPGSKVIRDAFWWLPILGLYTGCRLEELAQLRRADLAEEGGIAFLRVTDEGVGMQVKNEQSKRRIPLHPFVLRLGFMEWAAKRAPMPDDPVFPELPRSGPDEKRGGRFTKWFSHYRSAIGMRTAGVDFHSFRKNFTDAAYAVCGQDAVVDELTGHAGDGKSISRTTYKSANVTPLPKLAAVVGEIDFPELAHLLDLPA